MTPVIIKLNFEFHACDQFLEYLLVNKVMLILHIIFMAMYYINDFCEINLLPTNIYMCECISGGIISLLFWNADILPI